MSALGGKGVTRVGVLTLRVVAGSPLDIHPRLPLGLPGEVKHAGFRLCAVALLRLLEVGVQQQLVVVGQAGGQRLRTLDGTREAFVQRQLHRLLRPTLRAGSRRCGRPTLCVGIPKEGGKGVCNRVGQQPGVHRRRRRVPLAHCGDEGGPARGAPLGTQLAVRALDAAAVRHGAPVPHHDPLALRHIAVCQVVVTRLALHKPAEQRVVVGALRHVEQQVAHHVRRRRPLSLPHALVQERERLSGRRLRLLRQQRAAEQRHVARRQARPRKGRRVLRIAQGQARRRVEVQAAQLVLGGGHGERQRVAAEAEAYAERCCVHAGGGVGLEQRIRRHGERGVAACEGCQQRGALLRGRLLRRAHHEVGCVGIGALQQRVARCVLLEHKRQPRNVHLVVQLIGLVVFDVRHSHRLVRSPLLV
eukprot:Rhum_TRINITY_DN21222_c0_g1::Rhum_TRINITY_DN21222_c0_g1_i1::g.173527::m.173527